MVQKDVMNERQTDGLRTFVVNYTKIYENC